MDITADQLGYPAVVVAPEAEMQGRYLAGRQDWVDEAAMTMARDLGCADMLVHQVMTDDRSDGRESGASRRATDGPPA
jgi:hypothetical protein